jgi:hypothetical protein
MTSQTSNQTRVTVELWVWPDRDYLDEDHDIALRRLDQLAQRGVIDEYRLHEWPRQLDVSSAQPATPEARLARQRIETFREWAGRENVRLPLPDPTKVGTGRMGPEVDVLHLPPLVIAEFRDGELAFVAPCIETEGGCSVEDRLDHLAGTGGGIVATG